MNIQYYQYKQRPSTRVLVDAVQGLKLVPYAVQQAHGGLSLQQEAWISDTEKNAVATIKKIKAEGYAIQTASVTMTTHVEKAPPKP